MLLKSFHSENRTKLLFQILKKIVLLAEILQIVNFMIF